jgi:DNA-binding response OmpR family regulator/two-component sensor histidine kinase
LSIHIRPPFWKTPLAYGIFIFIVVIIILLALYYNKLMHDVRSTREKLRYIANMAHEIKTPLSLIRAPISDLIRQADDEKVSEKLTLAMKNIERLQKKIRQFLDFKRIEKIENIHPEKIDLVAFVRKKIFAFELVAKKQEVKIHFETLQETMEVYCDPDLLDRIISNLLSNAVKYNRAGGFVNVRLQPEDSAWVLTVTDSGIGIPRKEQKKLFRPFFRASNAVREGTPGSGVGLALVYGMVRVLKGSIRFTSREGGGTTFVLKVPVGEPGLYDESYDQGLDRTPEAEEIPPAGQQDSFTILLVEDDEELRGYMKKEMSRHYRVLEASDGQEALAIVQRELPDLVLTDVAMPRMNGRQLCMSIKSQPATSHIPVILLSALDSKEHILKGLEAGADDYITKPFDPSILIAKIESLISNRKKVRERLLSAGVADSDVGIKGDFDREFVKKITQVINENLSDPDLSVRHLYTSAAMSRTAFYHKLKSLTDLSPAEFIRLIRLNKARELLESGKYNVSEVAYRCGFSDAKYFSTAFKKQFGDSPSAYLARK